MLYAKQISPEWQTDPLFGYSHDNFTDSYGNDFIIDGNREFKSFTNDAYDKIKKLSDLWYDYENYRSFGFGNKTEFIEFYCNRDDGKKYSGRDVSVWIKLLDNWSESESDIITALQLITRKSWRSVSIRGVCQSDWNDAYVSDSITNETISYVEMCYFNTGSEFIVSENYRDFKSGDGYSVYVSGASELRETYGKIKIYEITGYTHTPVYSLI